MTLASTIKTFNNEAHISDYIPITHLHSPTVFVTQQGCVGMVIHCEGAQCGCYSLTAVQKLIAQWHRVICLLDDNIAISVYVHRRSIQAQSQAHFKDDFSQKFYKDYNKQWQTKSLYTNDYYIVLLHKPCYLKRWLLWLGVVKKSQYHKQYQKQLLSHIANVQKHADQLTKYLSHFTPRIVGCNDAERSFSELSDFLGLVVNGGMGFYQHALATMPSMLCHIGDKTSRYAASHLGKYISCHRLVFADVIEFRHILTDQQRYAAVLSPRCFPDHDQPHMLFDLFSSDMQYISMQLFVKNKRSESLQSIKRHQTKMEQCGDEAISQLNALYHARDKVASSELDFGDYSHTILLLADSREELQAICENLHKTSVNTAYVLMRERIAQEPAFWSMIPGNMHLCPRRYMISSANCSAMMGCIIEPKGKQNSNHLGSALAIMPTTSRSPYYMQLHMPGAKDQPSVGHTMMVGGTGSGKTVCMGFLDVCLGQYAGRSYLFDRDQGFKIYVMACGGVYYSLSPQQEQTCQMNPFYMQDTAQNRQFCVLWLQQLIADDPLSTTPEVKAMLLECVAYGFDIVPHKQRCLSSVIKILPVNFPCWHSLHAWVAFNDLPGAWSYLFDHAEDKLHFSHKTGFDCSYLIENAPTHVIAAVLMYIFYRIEMAMGGELHSIFIDEAWQYFQDPLWQQRLKTWLATLRKKNAHVVMATQSVTDCIDTPLQACIRDNCATKIIFPNNNADTDSYKYMFNVTDEEMCFIKSQDPKWAHHMLLKYGHESVVLNIALENMQRYMAVISANAASLGEFEKLIQTYGCKPEQWLERFYAMRGA